MCIKALHRALYHLWFQNTIWIVLNLKLSTAPETKKKNENNTETRITSEVLPLLKSVLRLYWQVSSTTSFFGVSSRFQILNTFIVIMKIMNMTTAWLQVLGVKRNRLVYSTDCSLHAPRWSPLAPRPSMSLARWSPLAVRPSQFSPRWSPLAGRPSQFSPRPSMSLQEFHIGYWPLNAVRASQRCGVSNLVSWISFYAAMTRRLCETVLWPWVFWERIVIAEKIVRDLLTS